MSTPKGITIDNAIKIKCEFCILADVCIRRQRKEKYESSEMVTRCTITPNRPGENRKKRKKQKKA